MNFYSALPHIKPIKTPEKQNQQLMTHFKKA